jgi:hypothetical protein
MKRKISIRLLFIFFVLLRSSAFAQINITGPVCVIPGTVYQYNIQGAWDSATTMEVCVSGGVLSANGSKTCTGRNGVLSEVFVTWTSTSNGSVSVSSSKGNGQLDVKLTSILDPGSISGQLKSQSINSGTTPGTLTCSVSTGGSCSPSYVYQWQQSANELQWSDIPGATGQHLNFSNPLTETTFFRRKTRELISGTIAYTDYVVVNTIAIAP